jgi:hypothetical protein
MNNLLIYEGKYESMPGGVVSGCAYCSGQDLYIIQINGLSAFMNDSHKMIAGRELWGTPHEGEVLLVEVIGLIINEYRHRPEILPALVAQTEPGPCKTEGCLISNAI